MNLVPIPAFEDNYIWMQHDGHNAVVVDPGDADPVIAVLKNLGLALRGILVTHHHGDHTGGISALRSFSDCPVYGPATESIPGPYQRQWGGTNLTLLGMQYRVLDVPGHTAGHIAYYCQIPGEAPVLFCGDTLFSGGCGRLFEGTPEQMLASLTALSELPESTRVCCAHEYTLSNLKFANEVDPLNADLQTYTSACRNLRQQDKPTLPSTIGQERKINPFLRCHEDELQASARRFDASATDTLGTFATLRAWKNQYR